VIEIIQQQALSQNFRLSRHAAEELADEDISIDALTEAIVNSVVLEDYPEHRRGPCCLVYGTTRVGRPLHVVCTTARPRMLVITVYEPKLPKWTSPTQRRAADQMLD
jgi:hypothetical protein